MESAVELNNLSFSYPDGTKALNGISLKIARGERVAVTGGNGAGKSTLLWHLNGLLLGEGEVRIFGRSVCLKNLDWAREKVGLVFQNPDDQLFCPTVFDDVAFGPLNLGLGGEEVRRRVRVALAAVGLAGFDAKSAHHLSFGEKRRVALATVLAMSPEIIALDEPSANLDAAGKELLKSALGRLNVTSIVATQDIFFAASVADRIILLEGGRVAADLPAADFIKKPELLSHFAPDIEEKKAFFDRLGRLPA